MAKVGIEDQPIHTFAPMQAGQAYLALIVHGNLNFVFRGTTAMQAVRAAQDWIAKEAGK